MKIDWSIINLIIQWLILRQVTNELKQWEKWHSFDSLPAREIELQNENHYPDARRGDINGFRLYIISGLDSVNRSVASQHFMFPIPVGELRASKRSIQ